MRVRVTMLQIAIALFIAVLAILVVVDVLAARFEAAAFERVTGKHVTTWEAMWLDLRVTSEVKP